MRKITGWMIYPRTKCSMTQPAFDWIVSEASAVGIELSVLFLEDITCVVDSERLTVWYEGKRVSVMPDFAMVRGYDFVVMRHLALMGIRMFNPHDAMYNSLDKVLTHQLLCAKSIPTPKTIYNCREYSVLHSEFGNNPFIAKYAKGNRGNEVYMIESEEQFVDVCNMYDEIISQEMITSSYGKDIRVWVVGEKAVDAVMRYNDNSFKSNFSLGGSVKRVEVDALIEKIAVDSAKAVGLDFAGVDLLYSSDGYTVCEVNGNAAFRSLATLQSEITIPRKLFTYIYISITAK